MIRLLMTLVVLALYTGQIAASGAFFERRAEGWFWYQDPPPPEEEPEEEQPEPVPGNAGLGLSDPRQALQHLQEQLEIAQARALMNPTDPDAVSDYMRLQQAVTQRAETFANTWQQVLWRTPELDNTLRNPVNQNAVHLWNDERNLLMQAFLSHTARSWGLWFFYRTDCPFCQRFSPVLAEFAASTGFEVLAISQDGGALPAFPDYQLDEGHSQLLGVEAVPAVFLVNPSTMDIHPLAYGFISPDELASRIYMTLEGETANPLTTSFQYQR